MIGRIVALRKAAGNLRVSWLLLPALINSVGRRDLFDKGRRRRNTLGNAQANGLQTLISSGERPKRPTEGVCGNREQLPAISQVSGQRGDRVSFREADLVALFL